MIEVDAESGRRDLVDDAGYERENPVVADPLVVEGRQHQNAATAMVDGMPGKARGLADRTRADAGHQLFGRNSLLDEHVEQGHALGPGHRIGLAGRAEYRESAGALVEQPAAERGKPPGIGLTAWRERCENGDEHPVK